MKMLTNFCGMSRNSFIALIFIFAFVSHTCNADLAFHVRKLIATESNNASTTTSQVAPTKSPESNTPQVNNQTNSNGTKPIDSNGSNKTENSNKNLGAPSPPVDKKDNGTVVDRGNGKANNGTTPNLGDNGSCEGALTSCRDREMFACIEASKGGSKQLFLVVQNEGETTLNVNVNLPNYLTNDLQPLEVPKHKTRRMDISSTVGKSTELIVDSGKAKCTLQLVRPVSVDNLIQQLSFYSKQVTPIYAAYASFILALLFGGTWACCKLRKKNQQNGIPYQELEMGLPESASGGNVDAAEGWDHDWDDDDWDEDNSVKSPGGQKIKSVSSDGLTSRSSKKDGWENDWDD